MVSAGAGISCMCLNKIQSQCTLLMPLVSLRLQIPQIVLQLAELIGPASVPASQFSAFASLSLPPIPIPIDLIQKIALAATIQEQMMAAFKIDMMSPTSPAMIASLMASFQANLSMAMPQFNLPTLAASINVTLPPLLQIAMAMSTISAMRAQFGIDLLAPSAVIALRAALALPGGPFRPPQMNLSASMMARMSAYAQLSAAIRLMGGLPNFLPRLQLMAQLHANLAIIPPKFMLMLSLLLALQQAATTMQSALNLNPFAINAAMAIKLALEPLQLLANLQMPPAAPWGSFAFNLGANFAAEFSAMASANFSAALAIPFPNFGPLSLLANLAMQANLAAPPCSSICPAAKLAA